MGPLMRLTAAGSSSPDLLGPIQPLLPYDFRGVASGCCSACFSSRKTYLTCQALAQSQFLGRFKATYAKADPHTGTSTQNQTALPMGGPGGPMCGLVCQLPSRKREPKASIYSYERRAGCTAGADQGWVSE